jgi:hypothetical protein
MTTAYQYDISSSVILPDFSSGIGGSFSLLLQDVLTLGPYRYSLFYVDPLEVTLVRDSLSDPGADEVVLVLGSLVPRPLTYAFGRIVHDPYLNEFLVVVGGRIVHVSLATFTITSATAVFAPADLRESLFALSEDRFTAYVAGFSLTTGARHLFVLSRSCGASDVFSEFVLQNAYNVVNEEDPLVESINAAAGVTAGSSGIIIPSCILSADSGPDTLLLGIKPSNGISWVGQYALTPSTANFVSSFEFANTGIATLSTVGFVDEVSQFGFFVTLAPRIGVAKIDLDRMEFVDFRPFLYQTRVDSVVFDQVTRRAVFIAVEGQTVIQLIPMEVDTFAFGTPVALPYSRPIRTTGGVRIAPSPQDSLLDGVFYVSYFVRNSYNARINPFHLLNDYELWVVEVNLASPLLPLRIVRSYIYSSSTPVVLGAEYELFWTVARFPLNPAELYVLREFVVATESSGFVSTRLADVERWSILDGSVLAVVTAVPFEFIDPSGTVFVDFASRRVYLEGAVIDALAETATVPPALFVPDPQLALHGQEAWFEPAGRLYTAVGNASLGLLNVFIGRPRDGPNIFDTVSLTNLYPAGASGVPNRYVPSVFIDASRALVYITSVWESSATLTEFCLSSDGCINTSGASVELAGAESFTLGASVSTAVTAMALIAALSHVL